MQQSDWLTLIVTALACGLGVLLTRLQQRIQHIIGAVLFIGGVLGLVFWFGYYRNGSSQAAEATQSMINSGTNNGIMNQGNNNVLSQTTINQTKQPRILLPEQIRTFLAVARISDNEAVNLKCNDASSEAIEYTNALAAMFRQAGWQPAFTPDEGNKMYDTFPKFSGVWILVGDSSHLPPKAKVIINGFTKAHIQFQIMQADKMLDHYSVPKYLLPDVSMPSDTYQVIVGVEP